MPQRSIISRNTALPYHPDCLAGETAALAVFLFSLIYERHARPFFAPQALLTIAYNCAKLTLRRGAQLMPSHKFHVGEIVELSRSVLRSASGGAYEVTKQLPKSDAGEYGYRIKSGNERHECFARESELSKA